MFQQEAELPTQYGAPAFTRHRRSERQQAMLRTTYRQGCALQASGRHQEAADAFAVAVAAAPDFADAVQNLGVSLFALSRFADAAKACATLAQLRPADAGTHFNLGMALLSAGNAQDAVPALQNAVRLDPGQAKHFRTLGQALAAADSKSEAVVALMKADALDPSDPTVLPRLTALLIDLGDRQAAAGAAALAVERDPGCARAQVSLATALHELGDSRAALGPARLASRLAPGDGAAAATLGAVLYTLGLHAEALDWCRRASALAPGLYQARMNEALALEALGRLDEAEHAARHAMRLAPKAADLRLNVAAMLLASGRLGTEAWALYESRLELPNALLNHPGHAPRWNGENVAGQTVLLHCEQGFGDTIQFLRYAAMVADRGAKIVLVVQPELLRLLQDVPGAHQVVPAGMPMPDHDWYCPLLSLPGILGTTLETIPAGPVITPDPALVRQWQLPPSPALKVGLVWGGSTVFLHNGARSIPLDLLAPLATIPGVALHSLQTPPQASDAVPMCDRMAGVTDFADTAGVIAGLDLVISVDSAVAHLAAAMGKEVWLLSRFVGCWRWLRNRGDSPWYPTMRIFGQAEPGNWEEAIGRVTDALAHRLGAALRPAAPPPARVVTAAAEASALDGLCLPEGAPRAVVVLVGENENGILRSVTQDFMALLPRHGLDSHVVQMGEPHWLGELTQLLAQGVLFAWGPAGAGARLPHPDGPLWDVIRTPFISVLADSPAWLPANHHVPSKYVANGYMYRDWLDMQRRLIRSPQIAGLLPHGVAANPARDDVPWSQRQHRMVLVKTGCDPARHRASWAALPPRFRAVVEDAAAAALGQGVGDISGIVLDCLAQRDLFLETRPDILFGLMQAVDIYVRDHRSTAMARALLDLPVDIIGRGWEHLASLGCRARFHAPVDAAALAPLYAETQFLLNTMPNFAHGTHERVVNGFAAKCCVVTNQNQDMAARFTPLPSYVGVDTAATELGDQMAALFHGTTRYDDRVDAAAALADREYSAAGFMRGLIDLALEVRSSAMYSGFCY